MASIQARPGKKGINYQVAVRPSDFPEIFKTLPTYEAAKQYGLDAEAKMRKERRALADPSSTLPPSGDLLDERLLDTLDQYVTQRCQHTWHGSNVPGLLRVVGDPTIRQLKPSWIKRFIKTSHRIGKDNDKGPYAWSTIEKQLSIVSSAIKWRAEELDINPPAFVVKESYFIEAAQFEGLDKDDLNNERDRRFEPGEEEALIQVLSELPGIVGQQWLLLLQFALATGARLQEMVLAEWKEIGASEEEWHIPGKHSKTKSRAMMLTDEAIDALQKLRLLRDPKNPRLFHALGYPTQGPMAKEPEDPIAHAAWKADVWELAPDRVSDAFMRYREKAGMPDFRFHDLRHEGISRFVLTQVDIPIKGIMEMVGHSSLEMLNRYAKLRPNELLRLMRRGSKVV